MPASPTAAPERIKDANVRYHDAAAAEYDSKWGIDFGSDRPAASAGKVEKALGRWPEARSRTPWRSAPAPDTSRSTSCSSA